MSLELWTAHRYGALFGHPETKLHDELNPEAMAELLRGPEGLSLHNLLVINGDDGMRANKWLARYEKESK